MKYGFYVSTFITCGELQNVYNIKLRHDQSIALWRYDEKGIKLIRYWELERISGIKQHPRAFFNEKNFRKVLYGLLKQEGIREEEIIQIWGSKEVETDDTYKNLYNDDIAFHSIAHLLTSIYYNNPFPLKCKMIGLSLDAGPDSQFEKNAYDKKYYSGCVINEGNMEIFDIESPARLWSYSTKKYGMREGTLMALATAIDIMCPENIENDLQNIRFSNEEARINARYVMEIIDYRINQWIERNKEEYEKIKDIRFSDEENKLSMIMKIVDSLSKKIIDRNIKKVIEKYHINTREYIVALSGGFALNCPTNAYIMDKYQFLDYQIPPCTSDSGIALGVGLAGFYSENKEKNVPIEVSNAYYGTRLESLDEIKQLKSIEKIEKVTYDNIVTDIIKDHTIVWINGNAEIGPRALGNRSLIGDPRFTYTKDKLNEVKKRQWWRPVAPVILDQFGTFYFKKYRFSPNMLLNFYVNNQFKERVPAILHHDATARVQSVTKDTNEVLYNLLCAFYEKTQIPILCNTSLNDAGEPIVNTVREAIAFCQKKNYKYLFLNGRYKIYIQKDYIESDLRRLGWFEEERSIQEKIKKEENPYELNMEELTFFLDNPQIFAGKTLKSEKDIDIIKRKTKEYLEKNPRGLER